MVIYGDPVAQGRPRFSTIGWFVRAYDPAKSKDYKDYIRLAAVEQMNGNKPFEGAVALSLAVYRQIPKAFSKKKEALAEARKILPITKPDLDNYEKAVKDALKSICWRDDSQVCLHREPFGKFYSVRPRIEIIVSEVI